MRTRSELAENAFIVLASIKHSRVAVAVVADRLGVAESRAAVAVSELIATGLAEPWGDAATATHITMSALAAEQLGLVLTEDGQRWRKKGRGKGKVRDILPDGPGGHGAAMRAVDRDADDPLAPGGDGRPEPAVMLGISQVWWGPEWARGRPCPGCAKDREEYRRLKTAGARAAVIASRGERVCLICSARVETVAPRPAGRLRGHVGCAQGRAGVNLKKGQMTTRSSRFNYAGQRFTTTIS